MIFRISRFLLILGVLSVLAAGLVLLLSPAIYLILTLAAVAAVTARRGKPARRPSTAFGTARWAEMRDVIGAGMIGSADGLIIGRLLFPKPSGVWRAANNLFDRRLPSEAACLEFLVAVRAIHQPPREEPLVRLSQSVHTAVFAPTGAGKGISYVIPHLLTCPASCVVVDFKGENARLTAEHRCRVFGHDIVVLDPTGFSPSSRTASTPSTSSTAILPRRSTIAAISRRHWSSGPAARRTRTGPTSPKSGSRPWSRWWCVTGNPANALSPVGPRKAHRPSQDGRSHRTDVPVGRLGRNARPNRPPVETL